MSKTLRYHGVPFGWMKFPKALSRRWRGQKIVMYII
jgi:hypothetical protein